MLIDPAPTKAMGREELRKALRLKRARGRGFGINGSDTEDIALVNWCEDENVKVGGRVLGGDGAASVVTVAYPKVLCTHWSESRWPLHMICESSSPPPPPPRRLEIC